MYITRKDGRKYSNNPVAGNKLLQLLNISSVEYCHNSQQAQLEASALWKSCQGTCFHQ